MVDYKDINNKDRYIHYRDNQIYKLEKLGKEWTDSKYKQAVLLSYWYETYEKLLRKEENFKHQKKYFKYKRGQILFVNFGYRIGHELGGNHYCVVVSNNDSTHSGNVTVVPLRSFKGRINKRFQVNLEDSLQMSIAYNLKKTISSLKESSETNTTIANTLEYVFNAESADLILDSFDNLLEEFSDDYKIVNLINDARFYLLNNNTDELNNSIDDIKAFIKKRLEKIEKEIPLMQNKLSKALELNKGSIADINQITTISKLRILNPRRKEDTLSNIILDSEYMDQINNKIKELFVFDKK